MREIPLIYGFVLDGCKLRYRVVSDSQIAVTKIESTQRSDDWPYANCPMHFPARPFALAEVGTIKPKQVNQLTWQGIVGNPARQLVVIVPPSKRYGVSLWGDGDDSLVQVVFEIDPATGVVSAYNQCD